MATEILGIIITILIFVFAPLFAIFIVHKKGKPIARYGGIGLMSGAIIFSIIATLITFIKYKSGDFGLVILWGTQGVYFIIGLILFLVSLLKKAK